MCCFLRKNGSEVSNFIFCNNLLVFSWNIYYLISFLLFEFNWLIVGEQETSFLNVCIIKLVAADLPLCYSTNDDALDRFLDSADELLEDDGYFEDDYFAEEPEPSAGDGAGGGGVSLAGTAWDKKALEIAEEVALSFDGELGIYAFRSLLNATIQVRVERLTNKSGSPSMTDIEAFSKTYRARLDEAEASGNIPGNISLEVSSPGVERVVRIPQDLDRFKDRNLYVKYVIEVMETGSSSEHDGIFRLISYDSEANTCTWGLADVRINREKAGKGRPLSKKQKEWRLNTPFDSLRLVRFFPEI
ncbi:hypothetical protein ACS0TY_014063 [Phlomoides rotata]